MAALASPPASAAANPIMIMDHEANSSSSFNPETSKMNEKCNRIRDCLQKDQDDDEENEESSYNNSSCNNLWELRELALTEGGLCTGELRQKIWPALVGLRDDQLEETAKLFEPALLCDTVFSEEDDRERDLIRRDVGRSVLFHRNCPSPVSVVSSSAGNNHYPAANDSLLLDNRSATKKHNKNNDPELTTSTLAAVLTATVSAPLTPQQGKPFYYQGLHDIGGVLLQTMDLDEITTTAILRRLCQSHLRDAVRENFADLTWFLDTFLMRVLEKIDPQVHEAIVLSGVPLVSTVMPWLITWFTHCIHEEECASRLLDAFMASHPLLPFYFSVTLMVHPKFRMDIVTAELDDPSSMHFAIQHLPARIGSDWSTTSSAEQDGDCVPAQELIETAISIMECIPPRSLLDLLERPADASRGEMLERASRVALMKAPSSWTLVGGATSSSESTICSRAKIASGVHVLMTTQQYLDVVQEWRKPFGPPLIVSPPTKMNKKKSLRAKRKAMVRVIRQKVRLFLQIFFPPITAGEANSPMFQWPQQYSKAVALMILLVSFVISSVCGLADFFRFFFYYFIAVLYNPEAFLTTTASQHDIEPQSTMDHAEAEAAIMQPDLGLEMEVVQQ